MAADAIETTLDEIEKWAAGRPVDRDALRLMLELSRDHLSHTTPANFQSGDFEELLLEVYPGNVIIPSELDAVRIVESARDLVEFLEDTRDASVELSMELDVAVPEFMEIVRENLPDEDGLLGVLEELGLPTDRLAGIRLPSTEALVESARQSRLLAKAHALAGWAGEGKELDSEGDLLSDPAAACSAVGVEDRAELAVIQDLAEFVGFASTEEGRFARGARLDQWPDGDDVLDIWQTAFLSMLGFALDRRALLAGSEIEFGDVAPNLLLMLFLARDVGMPVEEVSDLIHELTEDHWHEWTEAHGDPALALLRTLEEVGAVVVDGEIVRYTPLGMYTVRERLLDSGVEVPLLPPVTDMTAEDLAALSMELSGPEMAHEVAEWLSTREPVAAARELLAIAAAGPARVRVWATTAVTGMDVPQVWREVLDSEVLGPYAKHALGETELTLPELGWITLDALALFVAVAEQGLPEVTHALAPMLPAGKEEELLDVMWRLPHPDVVAVLTMVGSYHPDKKLAKHARKAAHKASTRHPQH